MKKGKKYDTLAVINNYNCDTHKYTWTWRLYDRPGPDGRVRENSDDILRIKGSIYLFHTTLSPK